MVVIRVCYFPEQQKAYLSLPQRREGYAWVIFLEFPDILTTANLFTGKGGSVISFYGYLSLFPFGEDHFGTS